jgi:hypothetical protein
MSLNLEDRQFENLPFGRAALKKLGVVPENFRLYCARWLGNLECPHGMQVTGAEFERMKRKTTHGKKIRDTDRSVYVSRAEIEAEREPDGTN